jgi:hypothetical protein
MVSPHKLDDQLRRYYEIAVALLQKIESVKAVWNNNSSYGDFSQFSHREPDIYKIVVMAGINSGIDPQLCGSAGGSNSSQHCRLVLDTNVTES